jgi:cysteinyl-tRNA synthetase
VRSGNRILDSGESCAELAAAYDEIMSVLGLLEPGTGLDDIADAVAVIAADEGVRGDDAHEQIEALLAARVEARAVRDFARSDRIRDRLAAAGILLEDGPDGTSWHRR